MDLNNVMKSKTCVSMLYCFGFFSFYGAFNQKENPNDSDTFALGSFSSFHVFLDHVKMLGPLFIIQVKVILFFYLTFFETKLPSSAHILFGHKHWGCHFVCVIMNGATNKSRTSISTQ